MALAVRVGTTRLIDNDPLAPASGKDGTAGGR
jgi:hypothetical protein